jgi:hypothetical protein
LEKYQLSAESLFIDEAKALVDEARDYGVSLRIMGAIAIRIHSEAFSELHRRLKRLAEHEFTDLDFVAVRPIKELVEIFKKRGYTNRTQMMSFITPNREVYIGTKIPMVDVFVDKLEMCHTIDFRDRIDIDYPTITLADLLLQKIQILNINEKDVKDVTVLLRAHELGDTDRNTMNLAYVANTLSKDWGFYYTATTNLKKLRDSFLPNLTALERNDKEDVSRKITHILQTIDDTPKSVGWKVRARVGPRKKWYNDVGELVQSPG